MELKILFEDKSILVCYKPAGLAVQTKRLGQQDMESLLKNYRAEKGEEPYIGLVHRLDQPVEGIMVFGKTQEATAKLSEQIREHGAGKHYYAICKAATGNGKAELKEGETGRLTNFIAFDRRTNVSRIVSEKEKKQTGAKKAVLDYRVIALDRERVCFDINLGTGRHHQIRLQLAELGYPILGDVKYGEKEEGQKLQLALCSYEISFDHPDTGERIDLKICPQNPLFLDIPYNFA